MIYTHRVTMICPESLLADAMALATVLGQVPADAHTFYRLTHEDASGIRYSVATTLAREEFISAAGEPLAAPAHAAGVDLAAAERAQAALDVRSIAAPGVVSPSALVAVVGPNVAGVIVDPSVMGLSEIL